MVKLRRLLLALLAACLAAALSYWWQGRYWVDVNPPLCSAEQLLKGEEPYSGCYTIYADAPAAQYPLTTIVAFTPFTLLPGERWPAAAVWGVINALLVYGLLKNGKPWQFLILISAPYWVAFTYHQITPVVAAAYLVPALLPLALLKPQIGLPVLLSRLTSRRTAAAAAFIALTFAIRPSWLFEWWQSSGRNYDGVIPLLAAPFGLLMLAAVVYWRDPEVRMLLLMACVPQRALYDAVTAMLLPRSLRQMLAACYLSWMAAVPVLLWEAWRSPTAQVRLTLTLVYLPIMVMLVIDNYRTGQIRHTLTAASEVSNA